MATQTTEGIMGKIERSWKNPQPGKGDDPWKEIDEDRANRDLANAHGDNGADKLKKEGTLETQYGRYRYTDD